MELIPERRHAMSRTNSPSSARRLPISAVKQPEEQGNARGTETHVDTAQTDTAQTNTAQTNTVAALGRDIAQRVLQLQDEDLGGREQLTRIIIHSLLSLPDEGLAELVREPVSLEDPCWDALLQGLVAWRCQTANPKVRTPAWVKEVHLDEAWAPFGGSIRDDGWYTLSVLSTPAALLHRGIVLDRKNLEEL